MSSMNIPVEFSFLGGWYIHVYIHTSTISNYCKLLVNDSIFPLKAMVCHASGFLNTFRVRSSIRLDEHAWSIQPQSIAVDAQKNSGKNIKLLNIHMQRIDFPGESQAHIACRSLFFGLCWSLWNHVLLDLACIHRIIWGWHVLQFVEAEKLW